MQLKIINNNIMDKKTYIDRDTILLGSFSTRAGNNGCIYFNKYFDENKINAIYKSFSIQNIENAIRAIKTLDIKGFAISMPFKTQVIKYLDEITPQVKEINACNTVINNNGRLKGYNTDWLAIKEYMNNYKKCTFMYILGDGGYSKAMQYVCKILKIEYEIITRNNWNTIMNIRNSYIFNCTPVENIEENINKDNIFIDCIVTTESGKKLSELQANYQLEIYMREIFGIYL